MIIRIVAADERQAAFFDTQKPKTPLISAGSLKNGAAGLKDRDLETDRPGRRYGGTAGVSHGSGQNQSHHHGVGGERSTEQHDLTLYAKAVAERIETGRINHEFDQLVLIAPPKVLGLLRQSLSTPSQSLVVAEISKDLLHQGEQAIGNAIPWDDILFK